LPADAQRPLQSVQPDAPPAGTAAQSARSTGVSGGRDRWGSGPGTHLRQLPASVHRKPRQLEM